MSQMLKPISKKNKKKPGEYTQMMMDEYNQNQELQKYVEIQVPKNKRVMFQEDEDNGGNMWNKDQARSLTAPETKKIDITKVRVK